MNLSGKKILMDAHIIGVRFQKVGKVYHFDARRFRDIQVGDHAVVDTSRGRQLGEVVALINEPGKAPGGKWKPIVRRATPRDLVMRQLLEKKELEATINCRAKVSELGIEGIKIVTSEFTFDNTRLSILYSTEAEGKVDIKKLRTAIRRSYPHTRVELRQVGPRDVAKIIGGMGACGLATRCCSQFLAGFSPISIKMAKEQGISLTPSEITGMCGRLRCCLMYEYQHYVDARKKLPKRGKKVATPLGDGKIVDVFLLKETALVELDSGSQHEFGYQDLEPWQELRNLEKKAKEPCSKHGMGECDCKNVADVKPPPQKPKKNKHRPRS